ncbi:hypothetical protein T10_2013 [Trichinella papuae]|uniref:Uncharacterized protein n=1 Tax=Trichinella papuae TaxID=268474 RepID=A0A0V1MAS2_9BILA|nr:hypothetical protein T10_2013 [Trichinella papuae]
MRSCLKQYCATIMYYKNETQLIPLKSHNDSTFLAISRHIRFPTKQRYIGAYCKVSSESTLYLCDKSLLSFAEWLY